MSVLEALAGAGLPPLGVVLSQLARHMPRRIQVSSPLYGQPADITLIYNAGWDIQFAQDAPNERDLMFVEMALREESEARIFGYRQSFDEGWESGCYGAAVGPDPDAATWVYADSPALALAAALLAALEAGR